MIKLKKKLLFVTTGLLVGGAEKMLVNLANNLSDYFSIEIVSLSDDVPLADQIHPGAARVVVAARKWRYDLQPAQAIRKIISEAQTNAVIAFGMFEFLYIWLAIRGLKNKPTIFVTLHNTYFQSYKRYFFNLFYARLLSGRERLITVCEMQQEYWSRTYWIPARLFQTIYNGVDTDFFRKNGTHGNRLRIRSSYGIPEKATVILQVASLIPRKRHEDSLQAFRLLTERDRSRSYYLLVVGNGSVAREAKLKELADQSGGGRSNRVLWSSK